MDPNDDLAQLSKQQVVYTCYHCEGFGKHRHWCYYTGKVTKAQGEE